ncbi:spermidine/putrescine ABC transporter ATP-binding protein PotA [Candidatus Bandiella numerosa]|uniref:spermidine/putrescine ABC transporter ATP-binding protein PotA n=1 Tax=Candidatus Bandiella numerosa TaxID=2570586 RepID=UPI00249DCD10|nr:spermidine/putrescine ABC transporter ATP-binding protein PotA [Candidatus Bandiella numerosa]WHA04848.1 spermidine/putrescine ABC transporter ATP-binding protein PotA [Candidatus Bandiella numerosa]
MKNNFPILNLKNIHKNYQGEEIIKNVNFSVNNGEFVAILGPSGCGKTTILRLIGGFEKPDSGSIFINNLEVNNISPSNRKVNTVFQSYALFPHMNVFDNIAFGLVVEGKSKDYIKNEVSQIAKKVGLEKFLLRTPDQLSGGQKQRVAIARAIIKKPHILLLDEPLSALDKKLRQKMQVELKKLQKNLGITFIFVTHDQEEALSVADKVIVMSDGKIEQIGTPRDVYETPSNLFVAQFVGEINVFDAEITKVSNNKITLYVENEVTYTTKSNENFKVGDKVKLLFRPEDLRTETIKDSKTLKNVFIGKIEDTTYKGATLDSSIVLKSGKKIKASEFFDEDDADFDYKIGENITVHWIDGWEVILKNEER